MEQCQKRFWQDTYNIPVFEPLHGDAKTDVLIIGGGAAGILCAYFLKQRGIDYILAEGDRILSGETGGTTAKITSQHGLIYHKLIKTIGYEKAGLYLEAGQDAIEQYRRLSETYPCDFEKAPSYVYTLNNRRILEKELESVRRLLFPAEFRLKLLER